jgi:GDP-L-fucose synthase
MASRILRAKWQKASFAVVSNDGRARYELMHVDDLADACVFLLTACAEDEIVNIAYGRDTDIKTIGEYIARHLQFKGELIFDPTSFDDVPRHVLDSSRITTLGWHPQIVTIDVLKDTVLWLETQVQTVYKPDENTQLTLP